MSKLSFTIRCIGYFIVFAAVILAPVLFLSSYYIYILGIFGIYVIISTGLNLFQGYAGQLSLGHAGFVGIGAYTVALSSTALGIPYGLAILFGVIAAAIGGLMLGLPVVRLKEIYLVMATVAFGEMVTLTLIHLPDITQGDRGLAVPPFRLPIFGDLKIEGVYCLISSIAIIGLIAARNIVESRTGRAFMSIRDSEQAARSLGINVARYKTAAFVLSACYAGIGGWLLGALTLYIHPSNFTLFQSIDYLLIIVLGGLGTITGPIFGSAFLILLQEAFRGLPGGQEVIAGLLLFLCILFLPYGIKPVTFKYAEIGWKHLRAIYVKK